MGKGLNRPREGRCGCHLGVPWRLAIAGLACVLVASGCMAAPAGPAAPARTPAPTAAPVPAGIDKINHVVVIVEENWSFDALFGKFPGANGLANAGAAARQIQPDGTPYTVLPQPIVPGSNPPLLDPNFPTDLPNAPWDLTRYVPPGKETQDLLHRFYQEQYQIDGGKMDRFVAGSDAGGLAISYYDATRLPIGQLARQYTLADNFFHAAYGGSFLNYMFLICACPPVWPHAPQEQLIQFSENGALVTDGVVTPDGYAVNNVPPSNPPYPGSAPNPQSGLPLQTMPTVGEQLSARHVSWDWYSAGWNDAMAGKAGTAFSYDHQPFNYFAAYAPGQPARAEHLKDFTDFTQALKSGTLPAVSFVAPPANLSEHPGQASLLQSEQFLASLVQQIQASPVWKDTAVFIAYDENGGRWDHVAPPVIDRWGDGTRVPLIVVSPYARRGYVDHTQYDTTSILKFVETRWGLAPLGTRDAAAHDLTAAFDFSQQP